MLTIKTVLKFIFDMFVVFYLIYCIQDGVTGFLNWIGSLCVASCILVVSLRYCFTFQSSNYLYCHTCLSCILAYCLICCLACCRAYWLELCAAVCSFVYCCASWVAVNVVWQLFHGQLFHREEEPSKMVCVVSKNTESISWDQLYTGLEKLMLSMVPLVSQKAVM